jgi:hypothetical protein
LIVTALCCRQQGPSETSTTLPTPPFAGITATDGLGTILRPDSDDWRPIPGVTVTPAFPNPCLARDGTVLSFRTAAEDSVVIALLDRPNHVVDVALAERIDIGPHSLRLRLSPFPVGIYRVELRLHRADTVAVTYGDVEING